MTNEEANLYEKIIREIIQFEGIESTKSTGRSGLRYTINSLNFGINANGSVNEDFFRALINVVGRNKANDLVKEAGHKS